MLKAFCIIFFLFVFKAACCQLPVLGWAKIFDGYNTTNQTDHSHGRSIAVDAQGNVYSAGLLMQTHDFDPGSGIYPITATDPSSIYISKLGPGGDFIWAKKLPILIELTYIEIKIDQAGNLYLTSDFRQPVDFDPGPGVQTLTPKGWKDAFVLKLDTNGDFVWVKQFEGTGPLTGSNGTVLEIDKDNNVIVCGSFNKTIDFDPGPNTFTMTTMENAEAFITKLDKDGNFIWAKKFGNFNNLYGVVNIEDIKCDPSGTIYTTGNFNGDCDFDPSPSYYNLISGRPIDGFVARLNANGNLMWAKQVGYSFLNNFVLPLGIDLDNQNNVYTTGNFYGTQDFDPGPAVYNLTSFGGADTYVLKLSEQGNFVWVRGIGGANNEDAFDLCVDNANNVYLTGNFRETVDFDPGPGVFSINGLQGECVLTKLNSAGNFVYAVPFLPVPPGGGTTTGKRVVTDPLQNIYMTGFGGGAVDFDPGPGIFTAQSSSSSICPYVLKLSRCTGATSSTLTISTCNSYTLNNQIYNSSGIYTQVIPNSTGCDSMITLNLTINRKFTDQTKIICEGEWYFAGGANQTLSGIYRDTLRTSLGCDSIVTTNLVVNPKPHPDLGPDRKLCLSVSEMISPGSFSSYLWQDNSSQPQLSISTTGTYWVKVTNAYNCSVTDSIVIFAVDTLPKDFLPDDKLLCAGSSLLISVPGYKSYSWSTGDISSAVRIANAGVYYLTVTDNNNCIGSDTIVVQRDATCIPVNIPNAFTPNKDGLNDVFRPVILQDMVEYSFIVVNRYGQKIFETSDYNSGWDGTFNRVDQPMNSYVYYIRYKSMNGFLSEYTGLVTLIR